ncbi:MAG TPA: nucleotide sugar dehydrogenase [bacterium]|nr:nucleotide sugar dehydrogenase [bacterium]
MAKKQGSQTVLLDKIQGRRARIGVIGLGYVGLPLAVGFAEAGFRVTGIDLDPRKVAALKAGKNYIPDISNALVKDLVKRKLLVATGDFRAARELDTVSICVPTPLRKSRDPDISYIVHATAKLKKNLRRGQLIVLESTTYPGTTEEILLPELSSTGLEVGKDFFLAFSPERIDPGNTRFGLKNTPKIVGGITAACTEVSAALYRQVSDKVLTVSSSASAEMVKILENTFRAVNIGLVNEIAQICDKLKIDAWEVIEAAASKPFGFMPFYPGPGLGGHCIPVDPHYLSWKLRSMNYTTRFIELASEINHEMPDYVFQKIQAALNERKKSVKDAKILLLGVAYKKNVSDVRESPAYDLARRLIEAGAKLSYSDPHVPVWATDWGSFRSQKPSPKLLKGSDCTVIVTDHQAFDYRQVVATAPLIVDTRNATKGLVSKKIVKL